MGLQQPTSGTVTIDLDHSNVGMLFQDDALLPWRTAIDNVALGLRIRLGGPVALVVEDRYTLASAQVDAANSTQSLNVGGNFLSLGLMFHFLQPDEKSYTPTR